MPEELEGLPMVVVAGPLVCYWHGCPKWAVVRVGFAAPSLLAGQTRDYCTRHGRGVAALVGAKVTARLQQEAARPGRGVD